MSIAEDMQKDWNSNSTPPSLQKQVREAEEKARRGGKALRNVREGTCGAQAQYAREGACGERSRR